MAARIRKGDTVQVLAGKDKGKRGEVLRVNPEAERALVQGVNMIKRHQKPMGLKEPGGIIEREAPIHLSNIAPNDPMTDRPTRVGFKVLEDGKKVRFARGSGEVLDR
jgi:large subunit ribosomal protein L24